MPPIEHPDIRPRPSADSDEAQPRPLKAKVPGNPLCPCAEQQRLIEEVQRHLVLIVELSRAISEAVASRNENLTYELDRQVEAELGRNERALGALRQHRLDHGC